MDDQAADLQVERVAERVADRANRPVGRPRRRARRGRRRGPARGRARRRDGRGSPGRPRSRRSRSRAMGPPAKPVTPYDPRVAVRTTSTIARRVTSERPGVCSGGTRATSSSHGGSGGDRAGRRRPCGILPLPFGLVRARTLPNEPLRTTNGPRLRHLRQDIHGRFQPPVVGDEPRPRPSPDAAESPAPRHRGRRASRPGRSSAPAAAAR